MEEDTHAEAQYSSSEEAASSAKSRISIQVLSDQILEHIFTFLKFKQRARCEAVCKRWSKVNLSAPNLSLCYGNARYWANVDDPILISLLSRRGASCKKLSLNCNEKLTCGSISRIGQLCPELQHMELICKTPEQTDCLKGVASTCPHLKTLKFKNCETTNPVASMDCSVSCNEGMLEVAQNCTGIENVHVSNLLSISPDWLDLINTYLRTLEFRNVSDITSEAMRAAMRRCHTIQQFQLDYCNVSDQASLVQFMKYFRLTIRGLRMRNLYYVPNVNWRDVCSSLPHLETLDLYQCGVVDDELMEVLAIKCVKLRSLDICSSAVTEAGFRSLQELPELRRIKVSEEMIRGLELLSGQKLLRRVTIVGRSPGLEASCARLRKRFPRIRFTPEPLESSQAGGE